MRTGAGAVGSIGPQGAVHKDTRSERRQASGYSTMHIQVPPGARNETASRLTDTSTY